MLDPTIKLIKQVDKMGELEKSLRELKKKSVLVGIPQEKASRPEEGEKINNAELAYIHTNGSPKRNIPARPFIQPAVESKKQQLGDKFGQAIKNALTGKDPKPELEKAGMIAQNASRAWFTNPANNWMPNTEETIKRKGSDKPLIDTAEMRKSITYVVKEK